MSTVERVLGAVLVLSFAGLFFRWFEKQFVLFSWRYAEDWGHAYVVPLISGYYIWKHRAALAAIPLRPHWPAIAPVAASIVVYVYFIAGYSNHMFQGMAVLLAIGSLVVLTLGPRFFRAVALPIGFLGFAITISEMVMNKITWQLKLLASQGSWVLLNMLGVDTDVEGNVLTILTSAGDEIPLNVADACSGMRMVVAFIALSAAVAIFSCSRWWQRIAVVLLSVPVALLMNIIRVAVLGLLSLIDPELAVGEAHTMIGTILLVPAFGLFMLCVWVLKRLTSDPAELKGATG